MAPDASGEGPPEALARLVDAGVLDAELGALLWLLAEARVPVVVAGGAAASDRVALRDGLAALLPDETRVVSLAGSDEDFAWMPEAVELGWRRERGQGHAATRTTAADRTAIVADLDDVPAGTWGERARIAIRAISVGYDLLATSEGDRLEAVLDRLAAPPVHAAPDELARLGLVVILGDPGRVSAVHYLRPVARDAHGHVQRLPPAVVATWDPGAGRFEHFAWGIAAELAVRLGLRQTELEREQARRAQALSTAVETARTTRD